MVSSGAIGVTDQEFHKVAVTLPGSKLYKGNRAHVYETATTSLSCAYYNGEKEQSFFYECAGCALFVKYLLVRFIRHFQLLRDIQFNLDFERILPDDPKSIFRRDYDPSESDSPAYSFAITRITYISNLAVLAFDFLITDTF